LTGYVATEGKLAATDTVLDGFEKVGKSLDTTAGQIIVGNSSDVASPVTMSGAVTMDSDGVTTLEATGITSALLTGFTQTAGKITSSDTILQGFNQIASSLNTNSAQVIIGNASGIATPVTMSGDVSISNSGQTTIDSNAVTNAKSAQMAPFTIKGNNTALTANALDLSTSSVKNMVSSTSPAANDIPQTDSNKNLNVNNVIIGATSTVTAGGTTTLTVASTGLQIFTGTTTQSVQLPAANTLASGTTFTIINNSSGVVTVNNSGGTIQGSVNANTFMKFLCINTSSAAGQWRFFSAFPLTVSSFVEFTSGLSPTMQLGNIIVRLKQAVGLQIASVSSFTADITGIGISTGSRTLANIATTGSSIGTTLADLGGQTSNGHTFNLQHIWLNDRLNDRIYEIDYAFFGSATSTSTPRDAIMKVTQWN
jgi:hypothetical protein